MSDGPDYKPTPVVGMPAQPKTQELPAMTDRALLEDLARTTKTGFDQVRLLRGDVDLLVGDMASLKVDVRELQKWKIASEERQEKHSGGAKQLRVAVDTESKTNLDQDAAIAKIIAEQAEAKKRDEALEAKLDSNTSTTERILDVVDGVKGWAEKHPKFISSLTTVAGAGAYALYHWIFGGH